MNLPLRSARTVWFPPGTVIFLLLLFAVLVPLSPAPAQENDACLACHGDESLTMERKGREVSLFVSEAKFRSSAHAGLSCVMCHEGFDPAELPHAATIRSVRCTNCHDGEKIEKYRGSVHGVSGGRKRSAASCSDCHGTHEIRKISDLESADRARFSDEMCARCHEPVQEKYLASDHGRALTAGITGAPTCVSCHGEHDVVSPRADSAATYRTRQAELCLSCHLDNPDVRQRMGPTAGFIASYETSVHGRALKEGNTAAATCVDCHGSHEMKKGSNPESSVAKPHISRLCGTCHSPEQEQYDQSVHGKSLAAGITEAPTCTDCHGEHGILSPSDERSPVSGKNVSAQVCSPCHSSVRLSEKYGLSSDRFKTYEDSFHGLAGRSGSVAVANCASCHGVHDILPSSDPGSRINKANLAATCGSCHPGANENFAKGEVHVIARTSDEQVLYIVSNAYVVMIILIVGGMFAHNSLDFVRKARKQVLYRRGILHRKPVNRKVYLRMSFSERIQHGILAVSFTILVLSGFALRFPEAWWVKPVEGLSPFIFDLRGIVHRTAGVVMVLAGLYHIYYILAVPRGKQLLRDMLPLRKDIRDLAGVLGYNLGLADEKPGIGRFGYPEKLEYWALLWGSFVMAATGVILWFSTTFVGLLTKLGWDVARTVHYYEAWLATLSILVWHFYFVLFNPDVYPMNIAFWKGTLTEEEMEEEHPLELEEIHRKEKRELEMEEAEKKGKGA